MLNNGVSRANTLNCSIPTPKNLVFTSLKTEGNIPIPHTPPYNRLFKCVSTLRPNTGAGSAVTFIWASYRDFILHNHTHSHLDHHYQIASDHIQIKNTFNIFGQCWVPELCGWGMGRGGDRDTVDIRHHNTQPSRVWALIHIPICVASRARRKHWNTEQTTQVLRTLGIIQILRLSI